ncbi:MAG: outer membrane protein assembly factor BamD [Arenicellales bacterium]|jgi:outer membrane protein assembly factor BamD
MRNKTWLILIAVTIMLAGCSVFKKKDEVDENATVEELYERAKESMEKERWGTAVERLRVLEAKYPYGVYAEQVQLDTIYAYYKNDEPGLAIAAADRFIKLHPAHSSVDYAYYLKGLSSFEEDKSTFGFLLGKDDLSDRDPTLTLDALNAFKDVYTLFPESRYAPSARERVRYLTNALAKHQIAIATFYFSKGAHVAVVNRAKGVVENYPDAPAVEEALALLVRSYEAMDFVDLADDSRRVLELNFPDSTYLSGDTKIVGQWYSQSAKNKDSEGGFFSSFRNFFRKKPAG